MMYAIARGHPEERREEFIFPVVFPFEVVSLSALTFTFRIDCERQLSGRTGGQCI
jgi:hypothetical protein